MTDLDVRDRLARLMADEPPHRSLDPVLAAGAGRVRRRRLASGGAALAVAGVLATTAGVALSGSHGAVRDPAGFADGPSAAPVPRSTPTPSEPGMGQTLAPGARASYSYGITPGAGCAPETQQCGTYRFETWAVRAPVVAAVEFRLVDGTSKRVDTDQGRYHIVMTGAMPAGDRFARDGRLLDAQGEDTDLFAGLTLYAADGSVLATATATDSTQLDPYLETCDLLEDPKCAGS